MHVIEQIVKFPKSTEWQIITLHTHIYVSFVATAIMSFTINAKYSTILLLTVFRWYMNSRFTHSTYMLCVL